MERPQSRPPLGDTTLYVSCGAWVGYTSFLILFGAALTLLHVAVNGRYGFHRDELLSLDSARHLAWGYVVYPPLTPFLARIELILFGTSLRGFRFFVAVAQGLAFLFTGLAAHEIGGHRWAQLVAAAAVAVSGFSLFNGGLMSYSSLDYLWCVLAAYSVARLLRTQNPRWWLVVGTAIGLGLMTRYTIGLLILGILAGVLFTPARRQLKSPWFWAGAALAFLICLPTFLWQIHHHFIWLSWLHSIHARDLRLGSTDNFLLNQFWKTTNSVTIPFWLAGLWLLFAKREGKTWRLLGWMYVVPFLLLLALRGRDYYLAPAYPMLFAAGAVQAERWLSTLRPSVAREIRRATVIAFTISGFFIASVTLPIIPINTAWWRFADAITGGNFRSEIGWPQMVSTVAAVRSSLPPKTRPISPSSSETTAKPARSTSMAPPTASLPPSAAVTPFGLAATAILLRKPSSPST